MVAFEMLYGLGGKPLEGVYVTYLKINFHILFYSSFVLTMYPNIIPLLQVGGLHDTSTLL